MNWGYTSCSHKKNNSRNKNKKVKCIKIIYSYFKKIKLIIISHQLTVTLLNFFRIIIFVLYFLVIFMIL